MLGIHGILPGWLLCFILAAGCLFLVKMLYLASVALVLPYTGGALYVSTSRKKIAAFLDAIELSPGQVLVDLGCGDGRILRMAHRKFHVSAIGYEINPMAYLKARLLGIGIRGVDIYRRNFWDADLRRADVVICYLYPDVMQKLSSKLKLELKPETVVVSCNFQLPGWRPSRVIRLDSTLHNDPIYIYAET